MSNFYYFSTNSCRFLPTFLQNFLAFSGFSGFFWLFLAFSGFFWPNWTILCLLLILQQMVVRLWNWFNVNLLIYLLCMTVVMLLTFDNVHQTLSFSNFDQNFCKFVNSNFNLKFKDILYFPLTLYLKLVYTCKFTVRFSVAFHADIISWKRITLRFYTTTHL